MGLILPKLGPSAIKAHSQAKTKSIHLSPPLPPPRMKKARVLLLNPSFLPRATTIFSSASQTRLLSHQMETKPSSDSSRYCYDPVLRWDPQVEDYFNKAYGADHFARISKALTYFTFFLTLLFFVFSL